jgi:hypothetical protein
MESWSESRTRTRRSSSFSVVVWWVGVSIPCSGSPASMVTASETSLPLRIASGT